MDSSHLRWVYRTSGSFLHHSLLYSCRLGTFRMHLLHQEPSHLSSASGYILQVLSWMRYLLHDLLYPECTDTDVRYSISAEYYTGTDLPALRKLFLYCCFSMSGMVQEAFLLCQMPYIRASWHWIRSLPVSWSLLRILSVHFLPYRGSCPEDLPRYRPESMSTVRSHNGSPMYGFRMRSDCAPHRSVLL